jgi:hypothetical protein
VSKTKHLTTDAPFNSVRLDVRSVKYVQVPVRAIARSSRSRATPERSSPNGAATIRGDRSICDGSNLRTHNGGATTTATTAVSVSSRGNRNGVRATNDGSNVYGRSVRPIGLQHPRVGTTTHRRQDDVRPSDEASAFGSGVHDQADNRVPNPRAIGSLLLLLLLLLLPSWRFNDEIDCNFGSTAWLINVSVLPSTI